MTKTLTLLIGIFLMSTTEVALKLINSPQINSFQLTFYRFIIGGLFLFALANKTDFKKILLKRHFMLLSGLSIIFIILSMSFYQIAIQQYLASIVAIIFSLNPIFSSLFDYVLFHKIISRKLGISLAVAVLGMMIIIWSNHYFIFSGLIFATLSSILFGLYSTLSKEYIYKNHSDSITVTSQVFLLGSLYLLILHEIIIISYHSQNFAVKFLGQSLLLKITPHSLLAILYAGIIVTAGGFTVYSIATHKSPSVSHIIFFLKPAIAPIFVTILLNEKITENALIGMIIIVIGTGISLIRDPHKTIRD